MIVSFANFFLVQHAMKDASRQLLWVEHTHEVIIASEALLGQIRDAETGQRGYLLTGEPEYLEPYHSGLGATKQHFRVLKSLTLDNPAQQETLRQLAELVDQKFAELSKTIKYASAGDTHSALQLVNKGIGKKLMDQIRVLFGKFLSVEKKLLIQRESAYQHSQQQLELLFIAEAGGAITIILLVSLYVQRKLFRPLIALAREASRSEFEERKFETVTRSSDEIGILARALTSMHRTITKRTAELELISEELRQDRDSVLHASAIDPLTGLYNRRKFKEIIDRELRRARREGCYLDLTMLDIDFFKSVNDTYGHVKGDEILKEVAQCFLKMAQRPNDFVFRVGGEEFIFLTSRQDGRWAASFAEKLRANIEELRLPNQGSSVSKFVTVSAGVVSVTPNFEDTIDDLLRVADRRLYTAKSLGRNQVIASD